ncbi:hypothetical protein ACI3ER_12035 [Bacillus sp. Wb]
MTVQKLSYTEVTELFIMEGKDIDDLSSEYRECSCCEQHVSVDDISSECEINGRTHYDICDQCEHEMTNN